MTFKSPTVFATMLFSVSLLVGPAALAGGHGEGYHGPPSYLEAASVSVEDLNDGVRVTHTAEDEAAATELLEHMEARFQGDGWRRHGHGFLDEVVIEVERTGVDIVVTFRADDPETVTRMQDFHARMSEGEFHRRPARWGGEGCGQRGPEATECDAETCDTEACPRAASQGDDEWVCPRAGERDAPTTAE